jgi:hypothetical protein
MRITLEEYEVDEIITLLEELRYRAEREDDTDTVSEIDSVLDLLREEE